MDQILKFSWNFRKKCRENTGVVDVLSRKCQTITEPRIKNKTSFKVKKKCVYHPFSFNFQSPIIVWGHSRLYIAILNFNTTRARNCSSSRSLITTSTSQSVGWRPASSSSAAISRETRKIGNPSGVTQFATREREYLKGLCHEMNIFLRRIIGVTPPPSSPPFFPADPWIFYLKTT